MSMAKHLKQTKNKVFNRPFRKRGFGRHVADKEWSENEKKDRAEEVGEKKMAAVFDAVMIV